MSFTSYLQRGRERKISQFKWEQSRGDYLASNRVLAPTLRLKPFSITDISADVAPASPDPLEFPAPCPLRVCRFSASMLGHSVRPPDQWRVTRDLGIAAVQTHRQPHDTGPMYPPPPFRLELKSIQASPCLKSHSEGDEQLCPKGWSPSLRPWLASRRCEALTHSCPISRGLMLRLILSK